MDGMYPVMQEDGSILIYSEETDEPEYEVPAPYMYDTEGEESFDVFYNIETTNGDYYLTVFADSTWINAEDRVFPVTIDPSYIAYQEITMDTYINGEYPGETRGSYTFLYVGEDEKAYIYTPTPELPVLGKLIDAKLSVWYYYFNKVSTGYVDVTAHQVDGMTWSEGTLTWNMAQNYSDTYGLSNAKLGATLRLYGDIGAYKETPIKAQFNISVAVKDWIDNSGTNYGVGTNYGIGLDYVASSNRSVRLYSTEGSASYQPQLEYTYAVPYSIETLEEVDLNLYYDNAYGNRYSDASDRIEREAKELQEFFLVEFNIMVNYTGAASFSSSADACTSDYTKICDHATTNDCANSDAYFNSEGNIDYDIKEYHHTNFYNIFYTLMDTTNSASVRMYYIGHKTCYRTPVFFGCVENTQLNGIAAYELGKMMINNFTSETSETITAIHEMGHMFNAPDHYGIDCPSTDAMGNSNFSRNCLYGESKSDMKTIESIHICQGCRDIIESYRNRYSN